ncbi:MAG TPA: hypothetical protein VGR06_35920 [Actinophytocola sp.]|jgi:hypothetical protein|nr:hypothetical protein [Actinophytocola sp.]
MLHAIGLAAELKCPILALCSKWSSASRVREMATRLGVEVIAIGIDQFPGRLQPRLATDELLVGTPFERRTDLSQKRNFGLLFAHLRGWHRVVFLDDDIKVPEPIHLAQAAQLLGSYSGVGLSVEGMPDNSVVCHAYRESGCKQDTFIGGGALAVRTNAVESFFPNIYNDDWFYLLDDAGLRPVAKWGRAIQRPYDPFREVRARSEELGDCLAEGIFALLDEDHKVLDADESYWAGFLEDRRQLIEETIGRVRGLDRNPVEKRYMINALTAARGRSHTITPVLCVTYLKAWQDDRIRWAEHVSQAHCSDLNALFEPSPRSASRRGQWFDKDVAELRPTLAVAEVEGVTEDRFAAPVEVAEPVVEFGRLVVVHGDSQGDVPVLPSAGEVLGFVDQHGADAVVAVAEDDLEVGEQRDVG